VTGPAGERTLPLRVPIAAGEALDSWLERLARRYDMPMRQLLPVFGLPMRTMLDLHQLHVLPAEVLRRIEHQTGLAVGRLDQAVLPRLPDSWLPVTGSRFCPVCLAEHGQWLLAWRLHWTFACTHHHTILATCCPGCGQPLRHHLTAANAVLPPGICTTRLGGRVCRTDLTTASCWRLEDGDPRLHAQQWINQRLAACTDAVTKPLSGAVTDLADLAAVAGWIRFRACAADFTGYGGPTATAFDTYLARRHRHQGKPAAERLTDPLLLAAAAVRAVDLLTADTPLDILARLQPLLRPDGSDRNARGHRQSTPTGAFWMRTLSPARQATFLATLDPLLTPLDRLRYRTCTSIPRTPIRSRTAPARSRWLPQLLWADWTVRLTPPTGRSADSLREAAICWLLTPGRSRRDTRNLTAGLRQRWHSQAHPILANLPHHDQTAIIQVICRIADHLDEHGAPIDYQRRRDLIHADQQGGLLGWAQWQQLSFDAMAHPGQRRRHLDARRYLHQLLTGADLDEPHGDLTLHGPADRSSYLAFVDQLTTTLRDALHQHAAAHLQRLGLDEPLTWSPPADLAAGLDLPGRDPADLDPATVHRLVVLERLPLGVAAEQLDVSIDHIRHTLHTTVDRPARDWGVNAAPRSFHERHRAAALLTPDFFQHEYVDGGKRLHQLHAETGFHRNLLAEHAKHAGVQLADAQEPHHIDPDWLAEQYLTQRRSFPAIAADLGVSEMTVIRAARAASIAARPSGITSHPDMLTDLGEDYPLDLRRAVNGQLGGWQRLRRFRQAMQHPSLTTAARHTGAHVSALINQIRRLEHDIGATLINRGTVTTPMTPTTRGAQLLQLLDRPDIHALAEHHGQPPQGWKPDDPRRTRPRTGPPDRPPAPDPRTPRPAAPPTGTRSRPERRPQPSPAALPDDLRHAVTARGGWNRLHRFSTAMTYPTLTEASDALGITIATLIEQLHRLERDLGTQLFHRATPASDPQRPTTRGAALLVTLAQPDLQRLDRPPHQTTRANPPAVPADLPEHLLRAVQGQTSGWTRLERFAVTMAHPTINTAANTIGINRTTLTEQLRRLETDLGQPLYHRATADGEPQHPTKLGAALLQTLAQPDIQALHAKRTRLPRITA
jgi:DNA-binding transcriptional LysR family regulator